MQLQRPFERVTGLVVSRLTNLYTRFIAPAALACGGLSGWAAPAPVVVPVMAEPPFDEVAVAAAAAVVMVEVKVDAGDRGLLAASAGDILCEEATSGSFVVAVAPAATAETGAIDVDGLATCCAVVCGCQKIKFVYLNVSI